jgi:hypothetical protein
MGSRRRKVFRDGAQQAVLLAFALALAFLADAQAPGPSQPADPKAIMASVYRQDTSHDRTLRATMDVFDKTGQSRRKKFMLLRVGGLGDSKTLVRFTDPADIRGVTLLSINQSGVTDRQFIYIPAQQRVRPVAPRERAERFVGSDFTYEDIAEPVLDDFNYRTLSASDLMEGHETYKIEMDPVDPTRSQYKYIYCWIARDISVILHEEMYGQDGHLLRTLHASGLKRASGIWGARHIEVQTVPDGTRTVLTIDEAHFNTGLSEQLFLPDTFGTAKF